jgi:hypothetical protein
MKSNNPPNYLLQKRKSSFFLGPSNQENQPLDSLLPKKT